MACWAGSEECEVLLTECEVGSEDGNLPSLAPRGFYVPVVLEVSVHCPDP